jgi:hypothetical protein
MESDMQTLTSSANGPSSTRTLPGLSLVPGLLLTGTIAAAAFELRNLSGIAALSPLIIAIVLGLGFHNTVGTPAAFKPGVVFSMRRILRFAIILLGLQLSLSQLVEVGGVGLGIIVLTLAGTFLFTVRLGHWLGVDRKLVELIAAGTSICGASAHCRDEHGNPRFRRGHCLCRCLCHGIRLSLDAAVPSIGRAAAVDPPCLWTMGRCIDP